MADLLERHYHLKPEAPEDDPPFVVLSGQQLRDIASHVGEHEGDVRLDHKGQGYWDVWLMNDSLPVSSPQRIAAL